MASKKDYAAISAVIAKSHDPGYPNRIDKQSLVARLSDHFEKDNINFNRDMFTAACYGMAVYTEEPAKEKPDAV